MGSTTMIQHDMMRRGRCGSASPTYTVHDPEVWQSKTSSSSEEEQIQVHVRQVDLTAECFSIQTQLSDKEISE